MSLFFENISQVCMEYWPCALPPSSWKQAQALHQHTLYQGDNSLHTLRKETASIQTKCSPHSEKTRLPRDTPTYKEPSKTTVDNCFP